MEHEDGGICVQHMWPRVHAAVQHAASREECAQEAVRHHLSVVRTRRPVKGELEGTHDLEAQRPSRLYVVLRMRQP